MYFRKSFGILFPAFYEYLLFPDYRNVQEYTVYILNTGTPHFISLRFHSSSKVAENRLDAINLIYNVEIITDDRYFDSSF